MVAALDEAVKNVTESFMKEGLWENTILVFSTGMCKMGKKEDKSLKNVRKKLIGF